MRRVAALFAVLLLLLAGPLTFARASAQDATPASAAGDPVPIIGTEGVEVARVTIDSLTDPFEEYDPGSAPQRGFHFVALELTVENSGSRPFEVNPGAFYLVDADGFLYGQGGLYRGTEPEVPDLQYLADLAPDSSASGLLGFQVLNGTTLTAVVYIPRSDRLVVIAELGDVEAPAIGDATTVLGADGAESAQVTITELTDPFDEYDPSSPPQRGSHFVLVDVTVENVGVRPLEVDPADVILQDSDGFLYGRASVYRGEEPTPPDLQYVADVAPGAENSGVIGYQVLNGVEIVRALYVPSSDRLITLAVIGGDQAAPDAEDEDEEDLDDETQPALPDDEEEDDPEESPIAADCEGLQPWIDETFPRLQDAEALFSDLIGPDGEPSDDPAAFRDAGETLAELAEAQEGAAVPEVAADLNDLIAQRFSLQSDALLALADALDAADDAAIDTAFGILDEAEALLDDINPAMTALVTDCPGF